MMPFSENLCNISPDPNPYFFSKNLNIHDLSPAQIIQHLSSLFGLIYLANNGKPFIGFMPSEYLIQSDHKISLFKRDQSNQYCYCSDIDDPSIWMKVHSNNHDTFNDSFSGGYAGFIDYEFGASQSIEVNSNTQPHFFIGHYQSFLRLDDGQWCFCSYETDAEQIFERVCTLLQLKKPMIPFYLFEPCKARWSKSDYDHAFDRVQSYIRAGDCYQINLTQQFKAQVFGTLTTVCEAFWQLTQAPYAGFLKLKDFEVLSCSPELFIEFKSAREIITKPIKGTMPRYPDPELDEQSKQTLMHSEKDQAENVMIVDLLRNDLSVYAEIGSVKTTKLFDIESFNQVHHMVSEVKATLKPNIHPFDVLYKALPGGSITGAPKIRAMQIIEELEGAPRGAYCGSMGYFNYDGTGSWNILIRTLQKQDQQLSVWAGGGVTIASDCDAEYQECFDKISSLLELLNRFTTST